MKSPITRQYARSSRCLFFLDYDGTLAELQMTPAKAHLTHAEHAVLQQLCRRSQNTIVIVSGRDKEALDKWLAGLPVSMAAEYGHFIKEEGGSWQVQADRNPKWKTAIHPLLQTTCKLVPGSFIEDKAFSLVWHYRQADRALSRLAAEKLVDQLEPIIGQLDLRVMVDNKVVEIMVPGIDKSAIARRWLSKQSWDFILAAGDSASDEGLFAAVPKSAFTIKIGPGVSCARHHLANPSALSELLQELALA